MTYVSFFHFTDAENFHFRFLSPRSGMKKSWLLFLNPLKLHLWHQNGFFFRAGCWVDSKAAALQQTKAKINKRP